MSNQQIKVVFTPEGKAELTRILQLLQEADKAFTKLNADENSASLDFHNEGSSLNHCIRWGLQAAEDLNEAVDNPEPPELVIGEATTEYGVLSMTKNGVGHETFADERARSIYLSEQDASFDDFYILDVKGQVSDYYLAPTGKDALEDIAEDELNVYVIVSGEATDTEDETAPGVYLIQVSLSKAVVIENLTDRQQSAIAKAALDSFHNHQGISTLDDFRITVHFSNGEAIVDASEPSKTTKLVVDAEHCGKVSIDDVPFEFEGKEALRDEEVDDVTAIPYTYRDADNHKAHSIIYVSGQLSDGDWAIIRAALNDGNEFIPFDLDLDVDELQDRLPSFPSSSDHVFHEIDRDGIEHLEECPEGVTVIDKDDFVQAFARCAGVWDVEGSEIRLELGLSETERRNERVEALPSLKKSAGPAFTFHVFAMSAMQDQGGDPAKVDWAAVEDDSAIRSIANNKQPAASVLSVLLQHSPSAVTQKARDSLEKRVNAIALEFQSSPTQVAILQEAMERISKHRVEKGTNDYEVTLMALSALKRAGLTPTQAATRSNDGPSINP